MDEARESGGISARHGAPGAWLASNWPGIAAAEHAAHVASLDGPVRFTFFNAADAADVEAVTAQILPSGATPGARDARAAYFIDRALATFFGERAAAFRAGLADFQGTFHAAYPASASFAAASPSSMARARSRRRRGQRSRSSRPPS
jgi:hypothetical protein